MHALRGVMSTWSAALVAIMGRAGAETTFMNIPLVSTGRARDAICSKASRYRASTSESSPRPEREACPVSGVQPPAAHDRLRNTQLLTIYTPIDKLERAKGAPGAGPRGSAARQHHFPSAVRRQRQRGDRARARTGLPSCSRTSRWKSHSRTAVEIMEVLQNLNDLGLTIVVRTSSTSQFAKRASPATERSARMTGRRSPGASVAPETLPSLTTDRHFSLHSLIMDMHAPPPRSS